MQETLHDHHIAIFTGGSLYAKRFAHDIDLMDYSNGELQDVQTREVSTEKSKIMTNSPNDISADVSMNGQRLEEVTSFKYLGANLC